MTPGFNPLRISGILCLLATAICFIEWYSQNEKFKTHWKPTLVLIERPLAFRCATLPVSHPHVGDLQYCVSLLVRDDSVTYSFTPPEMQDAGSLAQAQTLMASIHKPGSYIKNLYCSKQDNSTCELKTPSVASDLLVVAGIFAWVGLSVLFIDFALRDKLI